MKVQHPINDWGFGSWYRCARVEFAGETATWELSRTGHYAFLKAYQKAPHRQLIQASDDAALRVFVKAWGPLRPYLFNRWSGSDPIATYRRERDRLTAFARLLNSVERPEMQRSALSGFIEFTGSDPDTQMSLYFGLQTLLQLPPDVTFLKFDESLQQSLEGLSQKQVEAAITQLVSTSELNGSPSRFTVEQHRRGNVLRASLGISNLVDALKWMVWQDVAQSHPIQFCIECRGLIDFKTQHAKKFCSQDCAHRKTAREWQQRKREKERKINGTQETR